MAWTAIWNHDGPVRAPDEKTARMAAATLLLEGRAAASGAALWSGRGEDGVSLKLAANGGLALNHRDLRLQTDPGLVQPGEAFRLTYRGQEDGNCGLEIRSLDRPGVTAVASGFRRAPLLTNDFVPAAPVMQTFGGFAALANHDAPFADGAGLECGTMVMTQAGPMAVEALVPGDIVLTGHGQPAIVQRTDRQEAVTLGSMNAVRLRAPYFGLTADAVVARGTPVLLSGPEVQYAFGADQVTVDAGDLINNRSIQRDLSEPVRDLVRVELDRPGALAVGGMRLLADVGAMPAPHIDRAAAQSLLALAGDARRLIA